MKTLFILLVVVILLSITALLVARRLKSPMTVPVNAHAGDLTLESYECKTRTATYKAECGALIVPENHLNPTSRLLALPVKRIHTASDSPREPIFYLGGGPAPASWPDRHAGAGPGCRCGLPQAARAD